jgi:hypothetical protein
MRLKSYKFEVPEQDKNLLVHKRTIHNEWKFTLMHELIAPGLHEGLMDDYTKDMHLTHYIILACIHESVIMELDLQYLTPCQIMDRMSRYAPAAVALANKFNREWEFLCPEPQMRWSDYRNKVCNHLQKLHDIGCSKTDEEIIAKLTTGWSGKWEIFASQTMNTFQVMDLTPTLDKVVAAFDTYEHQLDSLPNKSIEVAP